MTAEAISFYESVCPRCEAAQKHWARLYDGQVKCKVCGKFFMENEASVRKIPDIIIAIGVLEGIERTEVEKRRDDASHREGQEEAGAS